MRQPKKNRRQSQNRPNGEKSLAKSCKDKSAIEKLFAKPRRHSKRAKNEGLAGRARKDFGRQFPDPIRRWISCSPDASKVKPVSDSHQGGADNAHNENFRERLRLYSQSTEAESASKRPPGHDPSDNPLGCHRCKVKPNALPA